MSRFTGMQVQWPTFRGTAGLASGAGEGSKKVYQ